ncbi:MAG: OmpA family protein [Bacteroidetes bacterium]|nr:OmpA family protein [Bacteroidota bacterium]
MNNKQLIGILLAIALNFPASAQPDSTFNMVDTLLIMTGIKNPFRIKCFNAEEFITSENYQAAIEILAELAEEQPDNYNINFKLGYCYLKTKLEKHKGIKYLERAVRGASIDYNPDNLLETRSPLEAFYYLGTAYHINYQFKQAIDTLKHLKKLILPGENEFHGKIDRLITVCHDAAEIEKKSIPIILTHLGNRINTEYDEFSPVFPEDESFLVFTSRRKGSTGGLQLDDGSYYEDIYISYHKEGVWSNPKKVDHINTDFNEASVGLSPDGNTLFIYRAEGENGDIFVSRMGQDGFRTVPEKMPAPVNTRFRESHASVTSDGNTLYFTSDRKGGFGGMDIYVVSKLPNGEWSEAKNLGPNINTLYNEEGPFIMPDGNKIYFSSLGHKTMGGYDIFFSYLDADGEWTEAENIGYPINTTEDDAFFYPSADGRRAYYSTYNTGGFGMSDIFMITLPGEEDEELTVLSGGITLSQNSEVKANITVFDYNTGQMVGRYLPNPRTGKYLFILPPGKTYRVLYEADQYYPHLENIYIGDKSKYQEFEKMVLLRHISEINDFAAPSVSRDTVCISDLLFGFDKAEVETADLDRLATYLKKNPEAIIEIGGHADSNGPEIYNIHLSLRRAIFVYNFLIDKSVYPNCLVVKGYGEKYPMYEGEIPDGAEYDEMHKYNRRVEFKVLREGKDILIIKPVEITDSFVNSREDSILDDIFIDTDKDGILDKDDSCPDIPGVRTNRGCPEVKKEDEKVMTEAMEGLFFNTNSAVIKKNSYKVLNKVVSVMKANPDYKLMICGHTDNSGDPDANMKLSNDRAGAAREYIVKKGIEAGRIQAVGYGNTMPVAPNETDEGRAKNRRVEFTIVF